MSNKSFIEDMDNNIKGTNNTKNINNTVDILLTHNEEIRNRRFTLLLKLSDFNKIKMIANNDNISINSLCEDIIMKYVNDRIKSEHKKKDVLEKILNKV